MLALLRPFLSVTEGPSWQWTLPSFPSSSDLLGSGGRTTITFSSGSALGSSIAVYPALTDRSLDFLILLSSSFNFLPAFIELDKSFDESKTSSCFCMGWAGWIVR